MGQELTAIYITANKLREPLMSACRDQLVKALRGAPLISVSKSPIRFGENIVMDTPISAYNLYRQAYEGAKQAKTKYIAIAEDDTLYSHEHFFLRPPAGVFGYNTASWHLYTWITPAVLSHKGRLTHGNLVCERDLYLREMDERWRKYPTEESLSSDVPFCEPGRYEKIMGISTYPVASLRAEPNIIFIHEDAMGWGVQGNRKRLSKIRAYDIPYWGRADELLKLWTG